MGPIRENRFSISSGDEPDDAPGEIRRNRLSLAGTIRNRKYLPLAIISGAAVLAVAGVLLLTTFIKKPSLFTPTDKSGGESIYSDTEKKELPEGAVENIHLKRGIESYHRGYLNDALAEFAETVESDATNQEKAMALTYTGIIHDDKGDFIKAIESYNRALAYDRKNPVIYRNLALAYRHRKDYDRAAEYAEKAVEADSGNIHNRVLRGNIYFEQGRYADAAREYQAALETSPEDPPALYNLAIALLKKGDEVAAIEYLKRAGSADKIGPVAARAYGRLGVLFTERRDYPQAEKYLELAVSVAPRDAVNHYNLGIAYSRQNKNEKALEAFTRAGDLGQDDAAMLEGLGEAYYSLKDYDRSLEAYNRLLATSKRNARVLSRIAEIYYDRGDLDRAYEFYHKITTYEPASENARVAYLNMGNILDDAQRFEESIQAYEKALAINPKDDAALYNLGIAYNHAGKPQLAIESWKKAADLNPDNPQPLLALADYYYQNNHYDMAMDEYQRVLRRWPNIQDGHFSLATIYYKKNLLDYAREEYKRVIEINEKTDLARRAYVNLGILSSKMEKPTDDSMRDAVGYVQKALLLKPGDAEALFSLGLLYAKKEMHDKAIDTFHQALGATNDPALIAESYNNIGKCYYKKGLYKKALQYFNRGVEEDPANEEIRMNRKVAMQAYEEELARR